MAAQPESPIFSVAVVGLGMIGAAACRYLSSDVSRSASAATSLSNASSTTSKFDVVGIGPGEPQDWSKHTGVFGSHYDQGRLTRIVDANPVWSKLAARSIASYAALEQESGIVFHYPVGSLRVSPFLGQPHCTLQKSYDVGTSNGASAELIKDGEELSRSFPYFRFREADAAVMEHGGAGYVDPRQMVQAQLVVAAKHGASILRETVTEILAEDEEDAVQLRTDTGKLVRARKVLVCADTYTPSLIAAVAQGRTLALTTHKVSVLLAETGEEQQKRLQGMPSIIWRLQSNPFLHSIYACPPVPYPDGKVYLKIGGTVWEHESASGLDDITEWFHGSEWNLETDALHQVLLELILDLKPESLVRKPCFVSYTAHNYPYIDAVDGKPTSQSRVFVATGGCGAAAKSSDEIGRIAALLVGSGRWTYDLDSALFVAVWNDPPVQGVAISQV